VKHLEEELEEESEYLRDQEDDDEILDCPYCDRKFFKHQALGGHISRSHKGMSEIYQKKKEKRKEREPNRAFLSKVKHLVEL
jgi:uncharacterized C2H2 Zn-finger protein